jgi:hypothetical protein
VSNLRGALLFQFKRRSNPAGRSPSLAAFRGPSVAPAPGKHLFRRASMSRVPWHLFQDRQPRAHLVVGAVVQATEPGGGEELRGVQSLLKRLVTNQKPAGDYAATMVRDAGRPEIYLAFEDEGDARKFAAAVKAKASSSYPGWASQRAFQLDGVKLTALAASLPPPRTRPKKPLSG